MNNFTTIRSTFSQLSCQNNIQNTTPSLFTTKSDSSICSNKIQRSISVEEPMPSSFPSIPSSHSLHKPNVLDLRVFVFESELDTFSETLQHDPQNQFIKEYATNPVALLSPDSTSPATRGHVHTYSDCTASSAITPPGSAGDPSYVPLSPINRQQAYRNIAYDQRQNSFDRIMCEIPDIVDHVITKCNTDNATNNDSNTDNAHGQNGSGNNNGHNDKQHSDHNDSNGGSGCNNNNNNTNHSGGGGDDEKKRDNDKPIVDADENDESTEQKEKEDDEDDDEALRVKNENERKLNRDAVPFVPMTNRDRSQSANAVKKLLTIDEHNVLGMMTTKSAPMAPMTSPVLLKAFTPLCDDEEEAKVPSVPCANAKRQYVYTPDTLHRAQGWIKIPKKLTTTEIPNRIAESILNPYDFMDKSTGIAMYHDNVVYRGNVMILNYGFRDKQSHQPLYLVADKQPERTISKRNCKYVMRERLYTRDELCNVCKSKWGVLPRANHETLPDLSDKVNEIFTNPAALCKKYIFRTKWHKLPIVHAMNNNKEYNKQRLTFSMTKTEFISVVQRYVHNEDNHKPVIPMVMFNGNGCRVEYVQTVQIRKNIAIGISYVYNATKHSIKATGIHLNRDNILRQHQLYSPHHNCTCLDGFHSDIDDLHIGNPDDDKNRVKDLKKKNDCLNEQLKGKKKAINGLVIENKTLENRVRRLEQYIQSMNRYNNVPTPISPMCPEYMQSVTPQSTSATPLSILVTPSSSFYNYTPSMRTNTSITSQSGSMSTFEQYTTALNANDCNNANINSGRN